MKKPSKFAKIAVAALTGVGDAFTFGAASKVVKAAAPQFDLPPNKPTSDDQDQVETEDRVVTLVRRGTKFAIWGVLVYLFVSGKISLSDAEDLMEMSE